MTDKKKKELTPEEIEAQGGEEMPDREEMSLINANLAAPINAAVAANVLSDNSVAYADAEQTAPITQGNMAPPVSGIEAWPGTSRRHRRDAARRTQGGSRLPPGPP